VLVEHFCREESQQLFLALIYLLLVVSETGRTALKQAVQHLQQHVQTVQHLQQHVFVSRTPLYDLYLLPGDLLQLPAYLLGLPAYLLCCPTVCWSCPVTC